MSCVADVKAMSTKNASEYRTNKSDESESARPTKKRPPKNWVATTKYFFVLNISMNGLQSGFSDQGHRGERLAVVGPADLDFGRKHHPHPDVGKKPELEARDFRGLAEVERRLEVLAVEAEPLAVAEVGGALERVGERAVTLRGVLL